MEEKSERPDLRAEKRAGVMPPGACVDEKAQGLIS